MGDRAGIQDLADLGRSSCVSKWIHTASIVWVASMAYSRQDTTNNIAEYWGLIHGLREAQRMRLYYLNNDYIGLPGNSDLHNCIER
uniref:RNase H type-1 domain-containing protein n=1 Tax=Globisporangium ultimum (strain ATCC 200006 / CBS 805.95 / DAOM BR144) TaxID=431595 RepID=K3WFC5_GLOUD